MPFELLGFLAIAVIVLGPIAWWKERKEEQRRKAEGYREIVWTTADGRKVKIKDMEDLHLANVIYHCEKSPMANNYTQSLVEDLHKEATRRKLDRDFLDGAPYPWRSADGYYKEFDYKTCRGYKNVSEQ